MRTGRALLFQKRRPVVIERSETRLNRERLFRHILEAMCAPECRKFSLAAQGHVPLVSSGHRRIKRYRFVPEYAQHLHILSVIPHGCRYRTVRPCHTNHLVQRLRGIRDEVEHEKRQRPLEASIGEPELLRVTQQARLVIYGVLLLAVVIYMPTGIEGALRKLEQRLRKKHADER